MTNFPGYFSYDYEAKAKEARREEKKRKEEEVSREEDKNKLEKAQVKNSEMTVMNGILQLLWEIPKDRRVALLDYLKRRI